MLFNFSNL